MNTTKQVNVMIGLLFVAFLAFGAYYATEGPREASARAAQTDLMAHRGAELFVANCRTCHGQQGLGGDEGGVGPRLNNVAFLILDDANPFGLDPTPPGDVNGIHDFLFDTIACGRTNTAMPVWSDEHGGPLSATQIDYLVTMITTGRWDLVEEIGEEHDAALKAQLATAVVMFDKLYSDPDLTTEQKQAVDDAIAAGESAVFAALTPEQQEAVEVALGNAILAPDPTVLAVTTKNCGQYGAAVLDFRDRNPFATAGAAADSDPDAPADPAKMGQEIATQYGCVACHTVDGKAGVGPSWQGLSGHEVELASGETVTADDDYLRESILSPNAQVVKGFQPNIMPQTFGTQLSPEQIDSVIAYINSLK